MRKSNLVPFTKGVSGNPDGRPKGSRNRLSEAFLSALADDFDKHGKGAIEAMRKDDPSGYIRVVASLLPKDVNVKHTIIDELEGLSDEEIQKRLDALEKQIGRPQLH